MIVAFRVDGNPIPKQGYKKNRAGAQYVPKRQREWMKLVADHAAVAYKPRQPVKHKVQLRVFFIRGDRRYVDTDNLMKPIKDAMNNIIYVDDSQVKEEHIFLYYNKRAPGVVIQVHELSEEWAKGAYLYE